ncbi:MAG: ABC transporter ATP-binding protein/permease [Clostridia bacterium]|nr:ABC transporter ATP-binding protein/permease [Clostridia bacterium]
MPNARGKGGFKSIKRLIGLLFKNYKGLLFVVAVCLIISAITSSIAGVFLQNLYAQCELAIKGVPAGEVWKSIISILATMLGIYAVGWIANILMGLFGAVLTQRFLRDMRNSVFDKMQRLPIKYFDRNAHGDIMSIYTNDIDTIRQLVSQSLPQLCMTMITLVTLTIVMLYYSILLWAIVVVGVIAILFITKKIGGKSAKYFIAQQQSVGKVEGYIEEMMNGQKVVKVFCHENKTVSDFDKLNGELFDVSDKANGFSNMLMPIIHNIGNIMYVVIAFIGCGIYILSNGSGVNVGFSGLINNGSFVYALSIPVIVAFLGMARQFANQMGQISNQINSVIMGMAGATRVFNLLDEKPEEDNGYVTLVNAEYDENGNLREAAKRTGVWAWKHPHSADNSVTYTLLQGEIVMDDVDFGYDPDKIVLHGISLYAKPGQKIAFVGATGAGKTTITNLINRFYDIADGKIRYDGININKIKKGDLRRSLGIVLQDTNLFTGTVMDNIRYGKLDATDEESIAAAKLAGADDFITRLPKGYDTELSGNGANLSQGQRQLISIARAAVADPPVMILDEATSSIDTRTEAIVQRGMDRLMEGRTVFVIAHRLSTVMNSDVIMVLDHGRIIERGNHEKLIAEKGTYYQLYTGAFELE